MSPATLQLIPAGECPDITLMERADEMVVWTGFSQKIENLKASAEAALTTNPEDPASAKLARAARLALKTARVEIDKKRKELGDYHLRKTQAINAEAKQLVAIIEPYEERLLEVEKYAERKEAERKAELAAERTAELSKFTIVSAAIDYAALTQEEYDQMLGAAKVAHQARLELEKRIEAERLAKQQAEEAERKRIAEENERLRKEAAEREAQIAKERAEEEVTRRQAEEQARKEREAIEAKAAEELRAVNEKARIEREAAEAKASIEREAREKAERELAEKNAAEEKARKEQAAAERKAKAAPDRQKILAISGQVSRIQFPEMETEDGKAALINIIKQTQAFAKWIADRAKELEK